jgi:hypothetical protein
MMWHNHHSDLTFASLHKGHDAAVAVVDLMQSTFEFIHPETVNAQRHALAPLSRSRKRGVCLARDLDVNFVFSLPGERCETQTLQRRTGWVVAGSHVGWYLTTEDSYKLAPRASVCAASITVFLAPPFKQPAHNYDRGRCQCVGI